MPEIKLPLPDELNNALDAVTNDKQSFIINAVKEKLLKAKDAPRYEQLVEGYKSQHKENQNVLNDFSSTDLENWE
jgi:hypothetical protein